MHIGRCRTTTSLDLERRSRRTAPAPCATPVAEPEGLRHRLLGGRFAPVLLRPGALFRLWRRRSAESRELAAMSDRELRDIGVNRYEVTHALRRPFWTPW